MSRTGIIIALCVVAVLVVAFFWPITPASNSGGSNTNGNSTLPNINNFVQN